MPVLKRNLENLNLNEKFSILEYDIYESHILSKLGNKFDIIFLDPPYKDKNLDKLLIEIDNQKILNENGIIIIHRHKNQQDVIPNVFQIIEQKKYGISMITFLTN